MSRVPTAPDTTARGRYTGRIVLGLLLVVIGIGWLLDSLGVFDVRWQTLLPAFLVLIGGALLATAHREPSGGLIAAGILLSIVVLLSSLFALPFTGSLAGVGDVAHRPTSAEELTEGYALAVGSLEVDLRELPVPDDPVTVEVGVGIGELVVRLPEGVTVDVRARTGVGETNVDGLTRSGLGVEISERVDGETDAAVLTLEASTGIGKVEVRR